jgi:hypothetical protein
MRWNGSVGITEVQAEMASAAAIAAANTFSTAEADLVEGVAQTVIAGVADQSISVYAIDIACPDSISQFLLADSDDVAIERVPRLGKTDIVGAPIFLPYCPTPHFTVAAGKGLKMTATNGFDAAGHVTVYYRQE